MADESQEVLVFNSEEDRMSALDAVPEIPENESKIDEILKAPIQEEAADDNPASPESTEETVPVTESTETVPEGEVKAEGAKSAEDISETFTINATDLPEGFKNPTLVFKSYQEAQDLIERQKKFIKEKFESSDTSVNDAVRRAEQAEAKVQELLKQTEGKETTEDAPEKKVVIPESNRAQIKDLRLKIQDLRKDPVDNEEKILSARDELEELIIVENERLEAMNAQFADRFKKLETDTSTINQSVQDMVNRSKRLEEADRVQKSLQQDFRDIDDFSSKYGEFKLSQTAKEVDDAYAVWGANIARMYYGYRVDPFTQEGGAKMRHALAMLDKGAPSLVEACKVAGIATEPSADIKRYLEICELLEYRDGKRLNPASGKFEVVTRYHTPSGKNIPDTFPSLSDAYESRKVKDGVYEDRIKKAFEEGGKSMVAVATSVNDGSAEIGDEESVSKEVGGGDMTVEEALQIEAATDERAAYREAMAGKPQLWDKLQKAVQVLTAVKSG